MAYHKEKNGVNRDAQSIGTIYRLNNSNSHMVEYFCSWYLKVRSNSDNLFPCPSDKRMYVS